MNHEINNSVFTIFPELESERLKFRRFSLEDADDLLFLRSNDQVMRFMDIEKMTSIDEARKWIKNLLELYREQKGIGWIIVEKESSTAIGNFQFWNLWPKHCRAEIGYILHPDYWGLGYMRETLKLMMHFAFETFKLHSVEANVNPVNDRSFRALEKIGFRREAHFHENYQFNGKFVDSFIYSLLQKDLTNV